MGLYPCHQRPTQTPHAAIDELESSGFGRAELSLVVGEHVVEEKLGHLYEKVSELDDDPKVPRTAYVSTEAIGDAEGARIGGLMHVGATAAGRAAPARRVHNANAKNVRNEALSLLSIFFLPFRAPRAATRGTRDGRLIELDRPDRLIDR